MNRRLAENFVNYQERASEFAVGDEVVPFGHSDELSGRVTAVWPAIGMVDVEFTSGNKRYPVEDLAHIKGDTSVAIPPHTNSAPGGQPTVSVPGGPEPELPEELREASTRRVAEAFVKRALYWSGRDRQYRAPAAEVSSGQYMCPKCKARGVESPLKPASYKRREGISERLMCCRSPECVFLIKQVDIINHPCNGGGA